MTVSAVDCVCLPTSMSIMDPLMEKAIRTHSSEGLTSMTTPIVPLHMPWSMRELLRYMTHASGCKRTDEGRFVFCLNIQFENEESHI